MSSSIEVGLNHFPVGVIQSLPGDRYFFAFHENYLQHPNPPILSQTFFKPSGELIPISKTTQLKLPAFFSNLLPEGYLRNYLAQVGRVNPQKEFNLLQLLGPDLPGAITINTQFESFDKKITNSNSNVISVEQAYRFSLAGVQLKFSAILEKKGLTIPAKGIGGDWIVKLPSLNFAHVPENEWSMLHLAREVGIPVPDIKLINLTNITGLPELGLSASSKALAIKRFDRSPTTRIHIEDFAQVYNIYPTEKYNRVSYTNMAKTIWLLTGEVGITDFIRRLVFTILIGNGDMHLKNWSLIYPDGRIPKLAPAYDFVSTIVYIPHEQLALTFVNTKNMYDITWQHFKRLAKKTDIPEQLIIPIVKDTIDKTLVAWELHKKNYDLPKEMLIRIQEHMKALLLLC